MEEVLSNSDAVRTGWMILVAQLFISIMVAIFIVRKARMELDKLMINKDFQINGEPGLNLVVCEKWWEWKIYENKAIFMFIFFSY